MQRAAVIVIDDTDVSLHDTHPLPESPNRTLMISEAITDHFPDIRRITEIDELDEQDECLLAVHAQAYVRHVLKQCESGDEEIISDNRDVRVCGQESKTAIFKAAAAGVEAVRLIMSGEATAVFCNVRPPGHHAKHGRGAGYCIFNNMAIAVTSLFAHYPKEEHRVAIVDWDAHCGDGTYDWLNDPHNEISSSVIFINTQQHFKWTYPHGRGKPNFEGGGNRRNLYSYNYACEFGDHEDVQQVWTEHIIPLLQQYQPTMIFISCGFDAHEYDLKTSELNFTNETYAWMTTQLKLICPRIVSILEGGYNDLALYEASTAHIRALLE